MAKYTDKAGASHPGMALSSVSPHTFRRSKAMHLLQSGNPLVVIRDFLGHANIKSTEIYARSHLNMKQHSWRPCHVSRLIGECSAGQKHKRAQKEHKRCQDPFSS